MADIIQDGRHQIMFFDSSKSNIYNLDILTDHSNIFMRMVIDGFVANNKILGNRFIKSKWPPKST